MNISPAYPHATGPVAILIDGAFFVARYKTLSKSSPSARDCAVAMYERAEWHARDCELYRVFYYGCPPLDYDIVNPISKQRIKLGTSQLAQFTNQLHDELRAMRKVALRMGAIRDGGRWQIKPSATKSILSGKLKIGSLGPEDIKPDMTQKGVDMRIGLDIAALAFKRQVKRIVLISGDNDFIPAAKLARTEGIDFILDAMGQRIKGQLFEHIDGLCEPPHGTQ